MSALFRSPKKGWHSVGGKPEEADLVKDIEETLRKMNLAKFEIQTKLKCNDAIWTPETGLVIASLKVQRNPLRNYYNTQGGMLEQMEYSFVENSAHTLRLNHRTSKLLILFSFALPLPHRSNHVLDDDHTRGCKACAI